MIALILSSVFALFSVACGGSGDDKKNNGDIANETYSETKITGDERPNIVVDKTSCTINVGGEVIVTPKVIFKGEKTKDTTDVTELTGDCFHYRILENNSIKIVGDKVGEGTFTIGATIDGYVLSGVTVTVNVIDAE